MFATCDARLEQVCAIQACYYSTIQPDSPARNGAGAREEAGRGGRRESAVF